MPRFTSLTSWIYDREKISLISRDHFNKKLWCGLNWIASLGVGENWLVSILRFVAFSSAQNLKTNRVKGNKSGEWRIPYMLCSLVLAQIFESKNLFKKQKVTAKNRKSRFDKKLWRRVLTVVKILYGPNSNRSTYNVNHTFFYIMC